MLSLNNIILKPVNLIYTNEWNINIFSTIKYIKQSSIMHCQITFINVLDKYFPENM